MLIPLIKYKICNLSTYVNIFEILDVILFTINSGYTGYSRCKKWKNQCEIRNLLYKIKIN